MQKSSKRIVWTRGAENTLLDLWQANIDGLRGPRKNVHIYREMAADMAQQKHMVGAEEVAMKIKNMTTKYRKIKNLGPSSGSPAAWVHFQRVHQIIDGSAVHNGVLEESVVERDSKPLIHSLPSPLQRPSQPSLLRPSSSPLSRPSLQPLPSQLTSPSPLSPTPLFLWKRSRSPSPAGSSSSSLLRPLASASPRAEPVDKIDRILQYCQEADRHLKEEKEDQKKEDRERLLRLEERKVEIMAQIMTECKSIATSLKEYVKIQKINKQKT